MGNDQGLNVPQNETKVMEVMLECHDLCAWYGQAQILFNVHLNVKRGEVVALMGRNGAGKSTTLKTLMGMTAKRSGTVTFLGQDQSHFEPHQAARRGLGFVPEDRRIFSELTVLENLSVARQGPRHHWHTTPPEQTLVQAPYWDFESIGALFPNLATMPHRLGSQMSGGEQKMLSVARSLMGNPWVLLLDEPSEGVSPLIVEKMGEMILSLKSQGLSILLSEQNIHFAKWVCDRAYVLEKGQIMASMSMADLAQDQETQKNYLSV